MSVIPEIPPVRVLPEDVANKIAAGEVVERPASVVKELLENALDARATRISVRIVAAGRRLIEVTDNGHGMSEQNALLAIERHATSKIRTAQDLESIRTLGFRGEALASIASVSRFELVTRREKDETATRLRVDGGILKDVVQVGAPMGTRVSVNRLYFNTPVRGKFLKGITTELSHCIDAVQRHALASEGVGFQLFHNEKLLLDVPEHASLIERVALIWGLHFAQEMIPVDGEHAGFRLKGVIGKPGLTRAQRSHQFFFMNRRPVVNRPLQYGLEEAYRGLITIGRQPVAVLLMSTHPRFVDVNIHPTKREIRFRDERAARDAVRLLVRESLADVAACLPEAIAQTAPETTSLAASTSPQLSAPMPPATTSREVVERMGSAVATFTNAKGSEDPVNVVAGDERQYATRGEMPESMVSVQTSAFLPGMEELPQPAEPDEDASVPQMELAAVYQRIGHLDDAPMQVFDTYLIVPREDRLLIIDQHALHERLNYDSLLAELQDRSYESQQLAVPIVLEVAPSQVRLVEKNLDLFARVGIEIEHFGGNSFQVTSICHLYDEALVRDLVYQILDEVAQGELFDRENFLADLLRVASHACKASIRAGDRLTPQERKVLLEGFRRLRPPYTCPHGRPILTEITLRQMEKSFRRIQ